MFAKKFLSIAVVAAAVFTTSCLKNDNGPTNTTTYQDPLLEVPTIDSFANAMGYTSMIYDSYYTGFKYEILAYGDTTNARPGKFPVFTAAYRGTLMNGTVFDSTSTVPGNADSTRPFYFSTQYTAPGFLIGAGKIGKGGHIRFIGASYYFYGNKQNGTIPPNSPLFFDLYVKNVSSN